MFATICNYVYDTHFESAYADSGVAHQTQEMPSISNLVASAEAKVAWFNQIKYHERQLLSCTTLSPRALKVTALYYKTRDIQ